MLTWLIPTTVDAGGYTYTSYGSTIGHSGASDNNNAEGITSNQSITVRYTHFSSNGSTDTFISNAGATSSYVSNSYITAASSMFEQANTSTIINESGASNSFTTQSGVSNFLGSSSTTSYIPSTSESSFPYSYISSETTTTSSRSAGASDSFSTATTQTCYSTSSYNNIVASGETTTTSQQAILTTSYSALYGNMAAYATGYAAESNEVGFVYTKPYSTFAFDEAFFQSFTNSTVIPPLNSYAIIATNAGDTSTIQSLITYSPETSDTHIGTTLSTNIEIIHFTNAHVGFGTYTVPGDTTQAIIRQITSTASSQDTTVISATLTFIDARQFYSVTETLSTSFLQTLTTFFGASTVQAGSNDTYTYRSFDSNNNPITETSTSWSTYDLGLYSTSTTTSTFEGITVISISESTLGSEFFASNGVTTGQQFIESSTAYGLASVWYSSASPTAMLKQPNMGFRIDESGSLYRGIDLGTLNPGILLSNIYSTAEIIPIILPNSISTTWYDGFSLSYSLSFDSASSLHVTTGSTVVDGTSISTQTGSSITAWNTSIPVTETLFYTTQGNVADTGSYNPTFTELNSVLLPSGAYSNASGSISFSNGSLSAVTTQTTFYPVPMMTATPGGVFWLTA